MTPSDYYTPDTSTTSRARIVGYLKAANLAAQNWITGSLPHQFLEAMTNAVLNGSVLTSALVRAFASLDTATDAGDVDPYDATNATATPTGGGALSDYGAGRYGTKRIGQTFATGIMRITNGSGSAIFIAPEEVTFARSTVNSAGFAPTYRNTADAAVYTNPDGTATIAAGAYLDVSVEAEEIGTDNQASAGQVSLVSSLGTGVTATNAAAILASEREDADAYRARCRVAAALLSLQGPADAYRVIALAAEKDESGNIFFLPPFGDGTTKIGVDSDGNFALFPAARGTSLGINRVYVDEDVPDGTVGVWIASAGGDPGAQALSDLVLLATAVYLPQCNTVSYHRANPVAVTVDGTVKAKRGAGVTAASVATAIDDAIDAAFPKFDIGGYDQTAGAGVLYLDEISATVNAAAPTIYKVALSSPVGNVALAKGDVPVPTNSIAAGDVTIV